MKDCCCNGNGQKNGCYEDNGCGKPDLCDIAQPVLDPCKQDCCKELLCKEKKAKPKPNGCCESKNNKKKSNGCCCCCCLQQPCSCNNGCNGNGASAKCNGCSGAVTLLFYCSNKKF